MLEPYLKEALFIYKKAAPTDAGAAFVISI
jgi:hypothetical protein